MLKALLITPHTTAPDSLETALQRQGIDCVMGENNNSQLLSHVKQNTIDIIIININKPHHDLLDTLHSINQAFPLPVIIFTQYSDHKTTQDAINAGVSAYIVDGWSEKRLPAIIDLATARFNESQQLKSERDESLLRLQERKAIDKAKGILMQQSQLNEEEAYQKLRKMAMNKNKRIGDIAQNVNDTFLLFKQD